MDPTGPTTTSSVSPPPAEPEAASPGQQPPYVPSRAGYFRWVICALLLFGTTKNYMDRQVLGILKTPLQHDLGWNEIDYSNLVFAFQTAYALGMVLVGRLIDRLGTRLGYALAMAFWSLASMAHALGSSFTGMVPQEGTRIRHRNFQCRNKRRRDHHPAHRTVDQPALGLALGFRGYGRSRIRLDCVLAVPLSQARGTPTRFQSRTRLHPQ
jgi:hypothetical protein